MVYHPISPFRHRHEYYPTPLTVTIRPLSWKYLTRGMVFCLKLVRRRSMALGLSSGRPCCSARFCSLSFKRWLVQARNTTRSGVQIYRARERLVKHYSQTLTAHTNLHSYSDVHDLTLSELQTGKLKIELKVYLIFKFNALGSKCQKCIRTRKKQHLNSQSIYFYF